MKRYAIFLLASAIFMSMVGTGCGETPAPAAPRPSPTQPVQMVSRPLVVAVQAETASLDPHQNDDGYSQQAQRGAYESLLDYIVVDGKVDVAPGLAASFKTDDARVWTLTLQKGVKFMDGTPFNAEAVKYNFDRVRGMRQAPASRLPGLESVETLDNNTVRITLANAQPAFSEHLTMLLMVSPTAAKTHAAADDPWGAKWMSENAVGTGPYTVENWAKGQTVTLAKNPDYWRGWNGNHLEKIILHFVKEAATRRLLLETGEVDIAEGIPDDDLDALSKVVGVVVRANERPSVYCMMLRPIGPLKDARVRRAIQLAFNYDGFIHGALSGRASRAEGPVPSQVWASGTNLPPTKQDLVAAKRLMAEAGFATGGFSIQIAMSPAEEWLRPDEAQTLQASLKEIGITATIQAFPDALSYLAAIGAADTGPGIFAWTIDSSINDPDESLRRLFYSTMTPEKGGVNYIRYSNPALDALINKGVSKSRREERLPIYQEIQRILVDDAVAVFAAQPQSFVTMRDGLQGYVWNPFSNYNSYEWYELWLSK
jgi:peptide/nickel transport system substrate-binding protein